MQEQEIPFQVEHLIKLLLNSKENVYIRANYRKRLDTISYHIGKALKKFDAELQAANQTERKKKSKS
jgi:hypothetical protein